MKYVDKILELASKLPTGLIDIRSPYKLKAEFKEMLEAETDIEAIAEVADVVYYAVKSIAFAADSQNLTVEEAFLACIAKYTLRAQEGNPKNHELESQAITKALRMWGKHDSTN